MYPAMRNLSFFLSCCVGLGLLVSAGHAQPTDPDKTMDVLVAAFKDESAEVRQAAGDALAKFGKDAVPPLIELLKSGNAEAQQQASVSLGEIGADAKDAVPLLKDRFLAEKSNH